MINASFDPLQFKFVNQVRAAYNQRTWFLKIAFVWTSVCAYVFTCVSAPKAINNCWRDVV